MDQQELYRVIDELQKGNEENFDVLYEYTRPLLFQQLYKMGAKECDAQDVVQEVFLRMYQRIHQLRDPYCYRKWIQRIASSEYYRFMQKNKRMVTLEEDFEVEEKREYLLPATCIADITQKDTLQDVMKPLKGNLQEVLILFYLKEMSEREIATAIQKPLGTVKSRLYMARQKMRMHA